MKCALIFDEDGRAIARELRSDDQWEGVLPEGLYEFVNAAESFQYKNVEEWCRWDGVVQRRQKVEIPHPARQRMRCQPAMSWGRVDESGTPWTPRTMYAEGDIAEGYRCRVPGISGDVKPAFNLPGEWEYMPPVEWVRGGAATDERQQLSIYQAGESIIVDGVSWIADRPGVTALSAPEFIGERVVDRESMIIPIPDLGDHPVDMLIGSDRYRTTEPIELIASEPMRIMIMLDSPLYYSDPYYISVESP